MNTSEDSHPFEDDDVEIRALEIIFGALETLTEEGKARALAYFVARYKIDPGVFT